MFHIENNDGLSFEQLRKIPAIFAENHAEKLSGKYNQISTIEIIDALNNKGWRPVWVGQCKTRDPKNIETSKHMVKFRNFQEDLKVGDSEIEFLLKNSHNGQCSNQFLAGLIRFLCANEMVLADEIFPSIRIKHINTSMSEVLNAADTMLKGVKKVKCTVEKMQGTPLDIGQRALFSSQALKLRYPENAPVAARDLLNVKRTGDLDNDLWTVFNRVQENLIRGGLPYVSVSEKNQVRHLKTREVKEIDQKVKLNQDLNALALQFV